MRPTFSKNNFEPLCHLFLHHCQTAKGLSEHTIRAYRQDLADATEFFKMKDMARRCYLTSLGREVLSCLSDKVEELHRELAAGSSCRTTENS
ncbi:site-specific integrase [Desulfurivibrio dismutans]|uniref:site-specific integrase n=1 Tax=Desulfurivibrio dismutans TaxID=1398908 RepID=UPI003D65130A